MTHNIRSVDGLAGHLRNEKMAPRAASLLLVCLALLPLPSSLAAPAQSAAKPVLTLNNTNEPPYSTPDHKGFADIVATEAFHRIGIELRLVQLPPERGLLSANAGIEDGDLTRIAGIESQYPNLVRVPEKLMDWEFSAFSKDRALPLDWPSIRMRPVSHIKGWKIYERQLEGATQVITADDATQLFRLLDSNRVQTVLYERWLGLSLIKRMGLSGISVQQPSLTTREMFIYLNKRHAELVPKLADSLRALKQDGFYRSARERALSSLGEKP